jgi:glutathione S-transferase
MAIETRLHEVIDLVETNPHDPESDIGLQNPLGKVPTLVTDDGFVIFDSPVICEYLDNLHGGTRMVPVATPARWRVLRLQALGDGIMDAAVGKVMEGRRPSGEQSPAFLALQDRKIARSVDWLENNVSELDGPLNLGQIAVACALAYLDFRLPDSGWRDGHASIAAWFAEAERRESMRMTSPA